MAFHADPLAFLRLPPFPGHRGYPLSTPMRAAQDSGRGQDGQAVADMLRQSRVGGAFWGAHPSWPADSDLLLVPDDTPQLMAMLAQGAGRRVTVLARYGLRVPPEIPQINGAADPWHLVDHAPEIWAGAGQELALIAALQGTPVRLFGEGAFQDAPRDPDTCLTRILGQAIYASPFTGDPWNVAQAIAQLAAWRRLIDGNRGIDAIYGVAYWKRVTLSPLFWDGSLPVRFRRRVPNRSAASARIALWKSRTPSTLLHALERQASCLGEIEDGFIRSSGLGANCVPPLSIIVDFSGIYFDPHQPSELENILQHHAFSEADGARAAALRHRLVAGAISKYGRGTTALEKPGNGRRVILVPGQVEDDRSVRTGGGNQSNLDLLAAARALEPQSYIIYKPHPDVQSGHRKGHVPEEKALHYADAIRDDASITSLIDIADALHVLTSLAGFEALLRGKPVTVHGMPFYAGWGLTRDCAPRPARRTRQRTLDELVAATLLFYPRYLDPVTRLPCPPEILVDRMASGQAQISAPLVRLRQIQGRAQLAWRGLRRRLPW